MALNKSYKFLDYAEDYLPGEVYRTRGKLPYQVMREMEDPFGSEPAKIDGGEMFAQFLALNKENGERALMPQMPAALQGYM